jgi:hypothetical protein
MTTIMKRIILGLWLLVFGSVLLSSCTKNDDNTIALIGTEYYIDDLLSVIPDSLQTRFFAAFGSIPEGPVPPKIEGSYVMSPKERLGSNLPNWPLSFIENNMWLRFSKQHNGIAKMEVNEVNETVTDTVFVCGHDNAFTVYCINQTAVDLDTAYFKMKTGTIMKGNVTEEGLDDFRYATIIMDVETNSPNSFNTPGTYFIYKDSDGLAKNEEW